MMKIDKKIDEEVQSGKINDKLKDHCVFCNARIPLNLDHYCKYGNSCMVCSARHSNLSEGIRDLKRVSYNGRWRWHGYRVREFNEEERKEMLLKRINEVKEQGLDK